MYIKIIAASMLFYTSMNIHAEQWDSVVESDSNATYFYDPGSIVRNGDVVTYWELVNYQKPLKSGQIVVASSRTKVIQDCKNNRFKIADLIDYDKHNAMGNIVNVEMARTTNWYQGTPDSVNSALKAIVCKE